MVLLAGMPASQPPPAVGLRHLPRLPATPDLACAPDDAAQVPVRPGHGAGGQVGSQHRQRALLQLRAAVARPGLRLHGALLAQGRGAGARQQEPPAALRPAAGPGLRRRARPGCEGRGCAAPARCAAARCRCAAAAWGPAWPGLPWPGLAWPGRQPARQAPTCAISSLRRALAPLPPAPPLPLPQAWPWRMRGRRTRRQWPTGASACWRRWSWRTRRPAPGR
jgi:hypothetical protein